MLPMRRHFDESATGGTATAAAPASPSPQTPAPSATPSAPLSRAIMDASTSGGTPAAPAAPQVPAHAPAIVQQAPPPTPGAAPVQTAEQQAEAQRQATLFDRVREQTGIDLSRKFKTEDELLKGLANATVLVGRRDADAEYGRQMRQYEADFQRYMQTQQQPQQQQAKEQTVWDVPEWNPSWEAFLKKDDLTGEFMILPGAPHGLKEKMDRRLEWEHNFRENWRNNPRETLKPLIQEMFQEQFQQGIGQHQMALTARHIERQNEAWVYEKDPTTGQPAIDPYTGQAMLSQKGQVYLKYVNEYRPFIQDPAQLDTLAQQLAIAEIIQNSLPAITNQGVNATQQQQPAAPQVSFTPTPVPAGGGHAPRRTAAPVDGRPKMPQFKGSISEQIRQAEAYARGQQA